MNRKQKWMHEDWKEKLVMWQAQELSRDGNYLRRFLILFLSVDAYTWCGVSFLCFFVFVFMENISLHSSLFLSGFVYSERGERERETCSKSSLSYFILFRLFAILHPRPLNVSSLGDRLQQREIVAVFLKTITKGFPHVQINYFVRRFQTTDSDF